MRKVLSKHFLILFSFLLFFAVTSFAGPAAPTRAAGGATSVTSASQRGLYLVFPFENAGASPRLDWLGEGLEELTIQRLSAGGEQVYSHNGRLLELERYGLPASARLSRATMLHVAEDLDADFVVYGSFTSDGSTLSIESRVLRVSPASLRPAVREKGSLDSLMDLHTRLVWRMLAENDSAYTLSLADFGKVQRPLRLDAFEHYIRGLLGNEDEARLRELREAARLEPEWPEPDYALGDTYFARKDCNAAIPWFARVPKTHDRYVEAVFATGVCRLLLNQPDRAEEVFTSLQTVLNKPVKTDHQVVNEVSGVDFPEVLNNLAIARARQGKNQPAQAGLRRAADLDPDEDDYAFNLGLLAIRAGDFPAAAGFFREASHRRPDNPEDRSLLIISLEKAGKKDEAEQERNSADEAFGPSGLPVVRWDAAGDSLSRLERIKTEIDMANLRFGIESSESHVSTSGSVSGENSLAHLRRARQELAAGRLDNAEHEYRAALTGDPRNPAAHRGLAEINRRQGKLDDSVKELQTSLQTRDSAVVRTILARVYLEQKKTGQARTEVERALKLAPNYTEAKQLLERLQNSKSAPTKPKGGTP